MDGVGKNAGGVLEAVLAELDAGRSAAEDRLAALLRIPSVSAQPAHAPDCVRAAEWLGQALRSLDFDVAIDPTPGLPIVRATHPGTGGGPRVLIYGHYDVQPAEPLAPWTAPPFEPVFVEGPHGRRVVARGAVDDKGQVMTWLEALRAWHTVAGGPPVPVTVIIEGEEEIGSLNLETYLLKNATALASDIAVISDTGMLGVDRPAITTRLRGLAYVEVTLRGPSHDLHSGMFGGAVLNPLNALTAILGGLHDGHGRVAIPGFYDGVSEPSARELEGWQGLDFDEAAFLGGVGLSHRSGEKDRPILERLWSRPTADINGLWGGYQGSGAKTVIAREAHAKVSFRLVPGQSPTAIVGAFERFVRDAAPAGATLEFVDHGASPGIVIEANNRFIAAARAVLADEFGREAVLIGCGGSIPVVESLERMLGLQSVLMGFGLEDDQMHGPNEKFEMVCLHQGARAHARLLAALSR
jgi:acetylornithine deacetylase/succinyl-diaminopimelate desuccinylase-like protein